MIKLAVEDGVAVVRLDRGVINALNLQLTQELAETLQRVKLASEVRGLVLGSANDKFFSIGFDIPQLFELTKNDFGRFYQAINRLCLELYTFPKPTVAAITGHAIAGGCILALCCDYRFIAEGRKLMGLNEIKLGVPVPYPADCILRQLVGWRLARDVIDTGEFFESERLLRMGIVDQILPIEQVLPSSIEKARGLKALPQSAFAIVKRNRVERVETEILARLGEKEQLFIECWYSSEARKNLKEAMKRF